MNKTRCSGTLTEAQFQTFVKNQLRGASWKWKPTSEVLKKARITRGVYLCNGCKKKVGSTTVKNGKRTKNVWIDHVIPVVDPQKGFTTWDDYINRLYCEEDNLQVLCSTCHDIKTAEERDSAKERRDKEKSFDA